jgi:hypothetical protein
VSSILIHVGINATAAIVTILALNGITIIKEFSNLVIVSLGGLAVTLVLLFIFIRLQPKPEAYEPVEEAPAGWFKKYWALVVAGILYAVVVGLTLYAQLSGATASTTLTYTRPEISAPLESRYQAVNRAGDVVGGMDCVITPQGDNFNLACDSEIEAFEVVIDNSTWIDEGHAAKLAVTWSSAFDLLDYSYEMTSSSGGAHNVKIGEDGLTVTNPAEETTTDLPETYLTDYEWAWRLYNLDGSGGLFYKTPYVYPSRWDNEAKKNAALIQDEVIHVAGEETLSLPAGEFKTVKVTLGSQTVWYDVTDTSAIYPVQFDDGMLIYSLVK